MTRLLFIALVIFALPVVAQTATTNRVFWTPFTPAVLVDIEGVDIQVKYEHCNVLPDVQPWIDVGTQTDPAVPEFFHDSIVRGDHCYRAFGKNSDVGRSAASNVAYKRVPKLVPATPAGVGVQ